MVQIPVCFVLMSRRRKVDYKKVFKAFVELTTDPNGNPPKVKKIMLDFEAALWTALRDLMNSNEFVEVQLKGCLFHFCQAIFKYILFLGLKKEYFKDQGTMVICQHLMSLPLLPVEKIVAQFERIEAECTAATHNVTQLKSLAAYVRATWISGRLWTHVDWCQHRQNVRTNNDVEGYHNGLNQRAQKGNRPFYGLVGNLKNEAISVGRKIVDIYQGDTTRKRKNEALVRHENLVELWDMLAEERLTAQGLLERASHKYVCK